ncbi:MAG: DUF1549 domain-containing protein, partial [Planctomycetes bacterium]|nr:DUF1549 domain-containing protein [Planctomycetota bacterium]
MRVPTPILLAATLIHVCAWLDTPATAEDAGLPGAAARTVDYRQDIEPILRRSCYSCHGPEVQESGLRLDDRKRALNGGDGGAVIVPGKAADSRLIRVVAGTDEDYGIMPPEGEGTPLAPTEVASLRVWIDRGAIWPEAATGEIARSDHWSLQPIARPDVPRIEAAHRVRNPIDAFVLARLQQQGIEPSPEAPPEMLIRRLYLDLIGLPPSPEEIDDFLRDTSGGAYERLVDRLLES